MNIMGNNLANSIKSGAGSDIIFGGDLNDTIYGGSGEDKIYGDAGNDKLYGDAGNDTLFGGLGNNTLTGGNGSDVFVYEGGNDVITDYAAGDSIKISSGKISKTSYSGKNLVFSIGDSTLTVKNAKGKQITVTDSNGNTTTQIYSGTQTYARTLDLLYDCNFMTDELQIDDISEVTADDYSIGQIQSISDSDIFDKEMLVSDSSFDKK
jgi:Ca2+-binding RTX toxin-like protein